MPIATRPEPDEEGNINTEGFSTTVGGKAFRHERTDKATMGTEEGYRIPQLTPMELTKILDIVEDDAVTFTEGIYEDLTISDTTLSPVTVRVAWIYVPQELLPKHGCRIRKITFYSPNEVKSPIYLAVFASNSSSIDPAEADASPLGNSASTQVSEYDDTLKCYKTEYTFTKNLRYTPGTGMRFLFTSSARLNTWPERNPGAGECVMEVKGTEDKYYVCNGCMYGVRTSGGYTPSPIKIEATPVVTFTCVEDNSLTYNSFAHTQDVANSPMTLEATNIMVDRSMIPNDPICMFAISADPEAVGKEGKIRCVLSTQNVDGQVQDYDNDASYKNFWEEAVISSPLVSLNYIDLAEAEGRMWWSFNFDVFSIPEGIPMRVAFIESDTEIPPVLNGNDVRKLHRAPALPVTVNRVNATEDEYPGFTVQAYGKNDTELLSHTTPAFMFSTFKASHETTFTVPWLEKDPPLSPQESGLDIIVDLGEDTTINLGYVLGCNRAEYDTGVETYATVDWGDGETVIIDGTEGYEEGSKLIHTYSEGGEHTITVAGEIYWGLDNPGEASNSLAHYCKELRVVENAFSPIRGGCGTSMFRNYKKLEKVDSHLLSYSSGITSLAYAFANTAITEIPNFFFDTLTEVTDFSLCFFECTKLKTLPFNVFAWNTKVTNFYGLFYGCTSLESVPNGIFNACPDVTSEGSMIAANIKQGGFNDLFYGCTSLTKIPSGLFKYNTKVTQFCRTFYESGITAIPEGFFDDNVAAESFYECFYACPNLAEVPADLFKNTTNANNFYRSFYNDTAILTSLPNTWELYPEANHTECFCGCEDAFNYDDAVDATWACPRVMKPGIELHITTTEESQVINMGYVLGQYKDSTNTTTIKGMLDWGDGSNVIGVRGIEGTEEGSRLIHTYAEPGEHIITLCGDLTWDGSNMEAAGLATTLADITFSEGVTSCPVQHVKKAFMGCTVLTHIMPEFFEHCDTVTDMSYTFYGCSALTGEWFQEHAPFANLTNVTTWEHAFENSAVDNLREDLFTASKVVTSFESTFAGCQNIDLPAGIFSAAGQATTFAGCFKGSEITTIPEELFTNCRAAKNFISCFEGSKLTVIPMHILANNPNATNLDRMFADITTLTPGENIPELWNQFPGAFHEDCFNTVQKAGNYAAARYAGWTAKGDSKGQYMQMELAMGETVKPPQGGDGGGGGFGGGGGMGIRLGEEEREASDYSVNLEAFIRFQKDAEDNYKCVYVDWGDDTALVNTRVEGLGALSHTYASKGYYTVTVGALAGDLIPEDTTDWNGGFTLTREREEELGNSIVPNIDYFSVPSAAGSSPIDDIDNTCGKGIFEDAASLMTVVGTLFDRITAAEEEDHRLDRLFKGCTLLSDIPNGLFDTFAGSAKLSADYTFQGCTRLNVKDSAIFEKLTNLDTVRYCFSGTLIESVTETFFANNPNLTSVEGCFSYCQKLLTIPDALFSKETHPLLENFSDCFFFCFLVEGELPAWWDQFIDADGTDCFTGTIRTSNYKVAVEHEWAAGMGETRFIVTTSQPNQTVSLGRRLGAMESSVGLEVLGILQYEEPYEEVLNQQETIPMAIAAMGSGFAGLDLPISVPGLFRVMTVPVTANVPMTISTGEDEDGGGDDGGGGDGGGGEEQETIIIQPDLYMFESTTQPDDTVFTHTYEEAGEHIIHVYGRVKWGDNNAEIANDLFPLITRIEIPESNTSAIYDIDEGGFEGLQVESIPEGLLLNCTMTESFRRVFANCPNLTSIPAALFNSCEAANDFTECFMDCNLVTGELPTWWETFPDAEGTDCFTGCYNTTNYRDAQDNNWARVSFASEELTFFIDQTKSDPEELITYSEYDITGVPMRMAYDETTMKGTLGYGDWDAEHWLLQKFRPCMLKTNGDVDYFLDRTDFTKREDGSASDYNNASYDGNAMVQIGQIWIKEEVIDDGHIQIHLAPNKIDDDYDCWSHFDSRNNLAPYVYAPMYQGSVVDDKVRSIAGQTFNASLSGVTQRQYCQNNGPGYDCYYWSMHRLLTYVMLMLGKTTDVQMAFGCGVFALTGSADHNPGGAEEDGMFSGYGPKPAREIWPKHVKVLGIEDLWGNAYELCNGFKGDASHAYIKMTPGNADGSTGTQGYTDTVDDYTAIEMQRTMTMSGFLSKVKCIPGKGLIPYEVHETDNKQADYTYFINRNWIENNANHWLRIGGIYTVDATAGLFTMSTGLLGNSAADCGVSLTYVPIVPIITLRLDMTDAKTVTLPIAEDAINNYTIDWGDGTIEEGLTGANPTHTYADSQVYDIKISGNCAWGADPAEPATIDETPETKEFTQALTAIELDGKCPFRSYKQGAFKDCVNLTTIPDGLFNNCYVETLDLTELFKGCTSLTLPGKLFTGLQATVKTVNLTETFKGCTGITTISGTIAEGLPHDTTFTSCFEDCTSVTGNLPTLWTTYPDAEHKNCFTSCKGANNYRAAQENHWAKYPFGSQALTFFIDQTQADPEKLITYVDEDDVGSAPMRMEYDATTHKGTMNFGEWEQDHWLLQKFKPCMLKTDGTVDYFLNRDDLTQKEEGGASDYNNASYDGNAMVQIGQIWIKEEVVDGDDDHITIHLAPTKIDDTYDCYSHYNEAGQLQDYIYAPMYQGSLVDGKIRSIAGQTCNVSTTSSQQIEYCKANGPGYNCYYWSLHRLLTYVLLMLGKTTNVQLAFGTGVLSPAGHANHNPGGNEADGMFSGYGPLSSATWAYHATALGMQDIWGNVYELCNGVLGGGPGKAYVKMTSEGNGYTTDTADYEAVELTGGESLGSFLTKVKCIPGKGLLPYAASGGSNSTYFCNNNWAWHSNLEILRVGGMFTNDGSAGMFTNSMGAANSQAADCGVALTYVPTFSTVMELHIETTEVDQEVDLGTSLGKYSTNSEVIGGIIDWGDESDLVKFSNGNGTTNKKFRHTYADIGEYVITIGGKIRWGDNADTEEEVGRTYVKNVLNKITIPNGRQSPIYDLGTYAFSDFKDLTSIPAGLFANCNEVMDFSRCFKNCIHLQSIPDHLFDNCTKATTFTSCFYNCQNITSIPSGLFSKCTQVTSFNGCFCNCQNITSIPSGLFSKCTQVTNFTNCFNSCRKLKAIPSGLFSECTQVTSFHACFNGCIDLRDIPANTFASCTEVNSFAYCFTECLPISIPSNLFDSCTRVTSFNYCFHNTNISTIPSGLFSKCTQVTSFADCFSSCDYITSAVPALWTTHASANGARCFSGCTSAANYDQIPEGWGGPAAT